MYYTRNGRSQFSGRVTHTDGELSMVEVQDVVILDDDDPIDIGDVLVVDSTGVEVCVEDANAFLVKAAPWGPI